MPSLQHEQADHDGMMDMGHLTVSTYESSLGDYLTNAEISHGGLSPAIQFHTADITAPMDTANAQNSKGSALVTLARDEPTTWRKSCLWYKNATQIHSTTLLTSQSHSKGKPNLSWTL